MAHINNIEIKNFKSIRHSKIEGCRRVNVFIGAPNVGKSNILEALSVLQFAAQREHDLDFHDFCRYEKEPEIFFEANIKEQTYVGCNDRIIINISLDDKNVVRFIPHISGNFPIPRVDNVMTLPDLDDVIIIFRKEVASLNLLKYQFKGVPKKEGSKAWPFRNLQSPFGDNLFEVVSNDIDLRKMFNDYLKQNGIRLLVDKTENSLKMLKDMNEDSFFQLPYSLMADTLQRLLFYKTAILTNKSAVLLFEEPEAHMFPPYIAKFTTDIIFEENDNQYFLTTHSPFVLTDFIEELKREDLSIYVVGYQKGETVVIRLTDEQINEVVQYGVDLFFNIESYLDD